MKESVGYIVWPAFFLLLLFSLVTVLLVLPSFFRKRIKAATTARIDTFSKLVGGLTAVLSFLISIAGITIPLGPIGKDEGRSMIEQYFQSIEGQQYDSAYRMLARARIEEVRRTIPQWGPEYF